MRAQRSNISYPLLTTIFEDVFQHTDPLTPTTSPNDVARWDSLQHIALVREIEATFAVDLSLDEMMEIRTVGDIEAILQRRGV